MESICCHYNIDCDNDLEDKKYMENLIEKLSEIQKFTFENMIQGKENIDLFCYENTEFLDE